MQYLRARYYNSEIRRFITEDSYKGEISNPLSLNYYAYCKGNPVNRVDPSGHKDYVYTSSSDYTVENDWGFWDFLNPDNYYAEIDGDRYLANSQETVELYNWNSVDSNFLNGTLDSLTTKADATDMSLNRIMSESIGGDLDFKLQLPENQLYLGNGVLYNRNEAGNFAWSYYLESKGYVAPLDGILAQGGSIVGNLKAEPIKNTYGGVISTSIASRFDEAWDVRARHAGTNYYYQNNNPWFR